MTELTETAEIVPAETVPAEPMPAVVVPRRKRFSDFARTAGGVSAIGVKELRGRMRGRRAFAIITIYLLLLGGFALMAEKLIESQYTSGFGNSSAFAGAAIGQGIFAALLMLMTLQVAFLAPSSTSGSISLEREKQTLELLIATPISSLAIVVGKLLSALVYVFLLIAASIPLMAVVFVYGGVGPEDVLRGYVVLIVTALGLGAFGLLCSSLVKRTQAASAITIFGVLALSIGSLFIILFWQALATADEGRGTGPIKGSPPAPLIFLNPFLAQADVAPTEALCSNTNSSLRYYCRFKETFLLDQNGVIFVNGANPPVQIDTIGGGPLTVAIDRAPVALGPDEIKKLQIIAAGGGGAGAVAGKELAIAGGAPVPFEVVDAGIWQKSVSAWFVLSIVFLLLSVQFVSPTRRWRLRRGPRRVEGPA